eukprot:5016731-Pyramimonas_sp.AAC.1
MVQNSGRATASKNGHRWFFPTQDERLRRSLQQDVRQAVAMLPADCTREAFDARVAQVLQRRGV